MQKYYSKKYIREKWDNLKWDIEKVLAIYDDGDDSIPEDDILRTRGAILDNCDAIISEITK